MLFLLPFLHTLAAFITFSVIYGFVSGALMILPPPIIALMTPNTAYLGVRMGLAYFCTAFAGLIGNLVTAVVNNDGNVADMRGFRFVWWGAALMMGAGMAILVEEA
jgi:MFS family permease